MGIPGAATLSLSGASGASQEQYLAAAQAAAMRAKKKTKHEL